MIWIGARHLSDSKGGVKKPAVVSTVCPYPQNKTAGEEKKKYLGNFKLSGPLDLNVCLQVNNISRLSIKKHLEEFGPSEGFQA